MRSMLVLVAAGALGGCAYSTSFVGAAKVADGPKGCKAACEAWGMDLAGMVKMGEYSDGCICQVKPLIAPTPAPAAPGAPAPQQPPTGSPSSATLGAPNAAVAGVWLQMQQAAAARAMDTQRPGEPGLLLERLGPAAGSPGFTAAGP